MSIIFLSLYLILILIIIIISGMIVYHIWVYYLDKKGALVTIIVFLFFLIVMLIVNFILAYKVDWNFFDDFFIF
jgi:hypothetical protein